MKRILFVFFFLALVVFPIRALGEEQISSTSGFDIAPISSSESITPITPVVIPVDLNIPTSTEIQATSSVSETSSTLPLLSTSTITESTTTVSTSTVMLVANSIEGTELNPASLSDLDLATSLVSSTDKTDPGTVSLSSAVSSNNICGDLNQDGKIDDLDPQVIIGYIFDGGQIPTGVNADVNGDDSIDISDAVYLISYLKSGGAAPKCHRVPAVNICTDLNQDGQITDADPQVIIDYIFNGGAIPEGVSLDVNNDGEIDISDAVYLIQYMKADGPAPKRCGNPVANSCSDLNRDGQLTDADPQVIIDYIFNHGQIPAGVSLDVNGDGEINISDAVYLIAYMKAGGSAPRCHPIPAVTICSDLNRDGQLTDADPQVIIDYIFNGGAIPKGVSLDVNGDGSIDISDAVFLISYMKSGGAAPVCSNLSPAFTDFNPPKNATATVSYGYVVKATDPENQPLIFSLLENPSGMLIASTTGQIDWTPAENQATSTPYSVMIQISDGVNNATTSYQIVVGPKPPADNNNPGDGGGGGSGGGTVTIGVPSGGGGALLSYGSSTASDGQFPIFIDFNPPKNATATWLYAYDVNATSPADRPLSFSLPNAPLGMWIIPSTGFILWQPDLSQVSGTPYSVVVQVSDGINTTSVSYFLTVSNPPIKNVSFVPLKLNTQEPALEPVTTTSTSTSTPSTTAGTSIPGNRSFAALIFSGLLDLLKNFGAWLQLNAGIVSLYLWLFLVLFLLIFWLTKRREKEEEKSKMIVSPVVAVPEEANALLAEIADNKKTAEPEIKEAEEVIELTPPLNLNFKKLSDSSRNN